MATAGEGLAKWTCVGLQICREDCVLWVEAVGPMSNVDGLERRRRTCTLASREGVITVSLKVGIAIGASISIFLDDFADDST